MEALTTPTPIPLSPPHRSFSHHSGILLIPVARRSRSYVISTRDSFRSPSLREVRNDEIFFLLYRNLVVNWFEEYFVIEVKIARERKFYLQNNIAFSHIIVLRKIKTSDQNSFNKQDFSSVSIDSVTKRELNIISLRRISLY